MGPSERWNAAFIDDVRGELEEVVMIVVVQRPTGSGEHALIPVQPTGKFEITQNKTSVKRK